MKKAALAILTSFLLLTLLGCSLVPLSSFDRSLRAATSPYEFSLLRWELGTVWKKLKSLFYPSPESPTHLRGAELVRRYFSSKNERARLRKEVEGILNQQIREVLAEEGIFNPWQRYLHLRLLFPPLSFKLEDPPNLLVVSPREEIKILRRVTLAPHLSVMEKEELEAKVDALNVSSLVVELGGLGATYPTLVANADLRSTIETVVEEWLHQYLTLRPLGFLYLLEATGLRPDYEVATLDETVAGMVSQEIAQRVCQKYYPELAERRVAKDSEFYREMREIRRKVDEYLSQGRVAEAEQFMQQKRDFLAQKGYHIRKLNQAYFAFYGTYAYDPTSISPIGRDLKELRKRCRSLREFLDKVAGMKGYDDLRKALGR